MDVFQGLPLNKKFPTPPRHPSWVRYPPVFDFRRSFVHLHGSSNPRPRRLLKMALGVIKTWTLFLLTSKRGHRLIMRSSGFHVLPTLLCGSLRRPCLQ
jgi:hypothetical protein